MFVRQGGGDFYFVVCFGLDNQSGCVVRGKNLPPFHLLHGHTTSRGREVFWCVGTNPGFLDHLGHTLLVRNLWIAQVVCTATTSRDQIPVHPHFGWKEKQILFKDARKCSTCARVGVDGGNTNNWSVRKRNKRKRIPQARHTVRHTTGGPLITVFSYRVDRNE
jgi:hypothetical protein